MMLLLFQINEDRYGLDVDSIVEVIPRVPLQRLPRMPDSVAGLLNFRGEVIPVLDLSQLLDERPSKPFLSTRIIVTKTNQVPQGCIGLMAEDVVETIKISEEDLNTTGLSNDMGSFVEAVVLDDYRMIQKIDHQKLLSEDLCQFLAYTDSAVTN